MPRGRKTALTIRLTPADQQTLLAWQRSHLIPAGRARRGRMLLLLAEGQSITAIADTMGISRRCVYKWAKRFLDLGLEGLSDKPGRGWKPGRPRLCCMPLRRECGRGVHMQDDAVSTYSRHAWRIDTAGVGERPGQSCHNRCGRGIQI